MDLKEFIKSAIEDVSSAVAEADAAIKESGGLVNPGGHVADGSGKASADSFVAPRSTLNFDMAVSAGEKSTEEASAKARIWVLEASIGGGEEIQSNTVSRLTFSIDVVLPHDKNQADRVGSVKSAPR